MTQHTKGTFDLTGWDVQASDEQDGTTFGRVLGSKTFHGGIDGSSAVELLTAVTEDGSAAYVAIERVTAAVDARSGSFVLQHAATAGENGGSMHVTVVPGLGTGELTGLRGEMQIEQHAGGEHTYTFDYDLA